MSIEATQSSSSDADVDVDVEPPVPTPTAAASSPASPSGGAAPSVTPHVIEEEDLVSPTVGVPSDGMKLAGFLGGVAVPVVVLVVVLAVRRRGNCRRLTSARRYSSLPHDPAAHASDAVAGPDVAGVATGVEHTADVEQAHSTAESDP